MPVLGSICILNYDMEHVLNHVKLPSVFGSFKREGSVFKSTKLIDGNIISFKVINNEYLLKHGG